MFTVKATYGNETRRFTFPDSVVFPTYEELHQQLSRLFPISRKYCLSRLIFSPDACKPGRILVGNEVHSAEDYDSYIAPLRRVWPNPLLRFTIFDETNPKTASSVASERLSLYSASTIPSSDVTCKSPPLAPRQSCVSSLNSRLSMPLPPPLPFKLTTPAIASSPSPPECGVAKAAPCCSVTKGRADLEALLSSFKEDVERIVLRTIRTGHTEQQALPLVKGCSCAASDINVVPPQTENPVHADSKKSRWCFVCRTIFDGVWYGCIKCSWHAVCPSCFSKSHSAHTSSFGPSHVVQQRSIDCPTPVSPQISGETKLHGGVSETSPLPGASLPGSTGEPTRPVHRGVICDECNKTVVGIRHKCLDCPNYDLCTACMKSEALEKHNPFHEFFDIEIPGRVYVHTVLSDSGNKNCQQVPTSNCAQVAQQGSPAIPADPPVRHSATCNFCDSAIVGERYKCIVCPGEVLTENGNGLGLTRLDFDTCQSCFRITANQHPGHGFVKVNKPEDLVIRNPISARQVTHHAECNSCHKVIHGIRYKCMHPGCPDFDLCNNCEALPIPVHPLNHPMLKLKTTDTAIPTVYGAGETRVIEEPCGQQPAVICGKPPVMVPLSPPAHQIEPHQVSSVVAPDRATNLVTEDQTPFAEEFLSPLGSPRSDVPGKASTVNFMPSPLRDVVEQPDSVQSTHPTLDIYHQLWPRVNQELKHLNAAQGPKTANPAHSAIGATVTQPNGTGLPVAEAPLLASSVAPSDSRAGESLYVCPVSPVSGTTKSIVDGYRTPSPVLCDVQDGVARQPPIDNLQETATANASGQSYLNSAFVADTNVPDGQVFPPGAEFVKGWHMMNNGGLPWPATTEIRFVAGDMFVSECSTALRAKVGVVHPGQSLDIWTGDLKAPDAPGRYVGYWRLNDGQDNFFGNSMWIDLTVADHHSDQGSEHSLAASSMVMPIVHPTNSVNASEEVGGAPQLSLPSSETMMDGADDPEFDIFSVSLVSVPSSDDEDAEWQDTRTHSEPLEYVVLYDSNSEE